jgi:hypothetical protein
MRRKIAKLEDRLAEYATEKAEHDDEYRKMLLTVIGALIVSWAYLENAIDAWVTLIHETGGAEDIQANLPASLDRELDYLKAAWKTTEVSEPLKEEGLRLMAEIHRLKSFRHDLVHGLADLNNMSAFVISLWKVKGAERIELKTPYPSEKIKAKVLAIVALKNDLDRFVVAFGEAMVNNLKNAR